MTVATKMRSDIEQARKTAVALAVSIAEGKTIPGKQIDSVRQAADMGVLEFATLVEKLEQRKAAADAYHGRDWPQELAANLQARRDLHQEVEALDKELTELRTKSQQAHERLSALSRRGSSIQQEQGEAKNAMTQALGKTGDRNDWRAIR